MPLTDAACKNAKCPEGKPRERYSDSGGLYLEVTAGGSKLWRWKYRYNGKEKRLAIGTYPQVSLLEARNLWPGLRIRAGPRAGRAQPGQGRAAGRGANVPLGQSVVDCVGQQHLLRLIRQAVRGHRHETYLMGAS